MSATLVTRPGDPQSIKPLAAATAANIICSTVPFSDQPTWTKLISPAYKDTITPSIRLFLILPDGSIIAEPNAMARYFLPPTTTTTQPPPPSSPSPSKGLALLKEIKEKVKPTSTTSTTISSSSTHYSLDIESWLEFEEHVLRPAAYSSSTTGGDNASLQSALKRLRDVLSDGRSYLDGQALSIADICLAATLQGPLAAGRLTSDTVLSWLAKATTPELKGDGEQTKAVYTADVAVAHPKMPIPGGRNILITSALPYVNNVPHLGNIIGCVLSADVYARFCRARGHNAIYICGTDEYGTATETKALEEGLTCQEICDKYHAVHAGIYEWFDISFDKFGRTPTRAQTEIGQEIFQTLEQQGCLQEQTIEQLYSEPLKKFLADRFVIGTCPKCRYDDARGDQCDACGSLLNPTELINPKCKLTGTTPVVKQTRHIFLDLPKLTPQLQAYIDNTSKTGGWSSNCVTLTNAWMTGGLKPRCITRDLKWGTPVPKEGYTDKVFYVWFDAPIGYISITANYCHDWKAWWMNPDDVELVQFMGKDNVPFHTVIFPSTLLGTEQPWTMMKSISVTEYLNYEDGKFSKSRGVGVFGNDAQETGIPVEVWRYYLLAMRPESQDSAFQWDHFAAMNNADLNDTLGNFIQRTVKFIYARYDKIIPGLPASYNPASNATGAEAAVAALGETLSTIVQQYIHALENIKMKEGLKLAMSVSRVGNLFFQDNEIWVAYKINPDAAAAYISSCAGLCLLIAILFRPYMPSFSDKLAAQLGININSPVEDLPGLNDDLILAAKNPATLMPAGHCITQQDPKPLFRKITDEEVAVFRQRFAGSQADREIIAAAVRGSGGGQKKSDSKQANGTPPPAAAPELERGDGKKSKDATKQSKKGAAPAPAAKDLPIDISRLDLRVGLIKNAWKHPDAESLYVEEIDVGEAEPRTVVSGLVKYIPEADMQNRRVILVCNLKPANMRGIKSCAMVLAATSPDGGTVELVEPPAAAGIGERVVVAGFGGEEGGQLPYEQLNPKKKVWEAVQPDLAVDGEKRACYKGIALSVKGVPCTVESVAAGSSIK